MSAREDDLAAITTQERELCFNDFDEEMAWSLGSRLRTMAVARKAGVVIDVRRFGQPLFYCALAGTSPDNVEWVRRKSNLVARFHRSSYGLGIEMGARLFEKYALPITDYRGARRIVSDLCARRGSDRVGHSVRIAAEGGSRAGGRSALRRARKGLRQTCVAESSLV